MNNHQAIFMLPTKMPNFKSSNIINGYIDDFASSLLLFERIENALRLRLQSFPNDENTLRELAVCKRKQGKLDDALEIYTDLSHQYPNNPNYSYIISALTAKLAGEIPESITRPCACPILEWKNFLPEQTIQDIFAYINKHQANFRLTHVGEGKGRYNPTARNNTHLDLKEHAVKKLIHGIITKRLSNICFFLGLRPFEASRVEVKLRAYHNGEYFRVHQDGGKGRQISYTYFFHPEPKRFEGGELVTFDTDTTTSNFNHCFTRIIPKRNSAFFFPSHFYHAVLPVQTQNDNFMSARFVINGHIWGKNN